MKKTKAFLKKLKKIKPSDQLFTVALIFALVLTLFQTVQLYSLKKALAKEGINALSAKSENISSQTLPDQVGGCF